MVKHAQALLLSCDFLLSVLTHRSNLHQFWIQSAYLYNLVQQPHSHQSLGNSGSSEIYSGSFYKLGEYLKYKSKEIN